MRVAGIDWATEAEKRALVELHLDIAQHRVAIERIVSPLPEHVVVQTARNGALSVVGVDVPFGWPTPFVHASTSRTERLFASCIRLSANGRCRCRRIESG